MTKMVSRTLNRIDRNGTKIWDVWGCQKCGGTGYIRGYEYIEGGRCFKCGGDGHGHRIEKEYTVEYQEKLIERRIKKAKKDAPEHNRKWLSKYGFNNDYTCFLIYGDTFENKEYLKENGCHYFNGLGWYSKEVFEIKEGLIFVKVDIKECLDFDLYDEIFSADVLKLKRLVKDSYPRQEENENTKVSNYVGDVGVRMKNIIVTYTNYFTFERPSFSGFGTDLMCIYLFEDNEGNVLKWVTGGFIGENIKVGDRLLLAGTPKEHKEYKGVKQTTLLRVNVKPV